MGNMRQLAFLLVCMLSVTAALGAEHTAGKTAVNEAQTESEKSIVHLTWNKDGTRQHDVYTDTYILKMSPQQHNGFYDIIWRAKGMKNGERKVYRWDAEKQEYGSSK